MPDKYAEYNPIKKELKIRDDTYENAINGIGRDRFTIAHEIGHIFLHSNNVSLARSNEEIPIYCNPEWQANTFARELLCPINGIIKGDNDETLAKRYGVSKEVARIQLSQKEQNLTESVLFYGYQKWCQIDLAHPNFIWKFEICQYDTLRKEIYNGKTKEN